MNDNRAITKTNQDWLSIRNWCFNNQLLRNADKTKLVIFWQPATTTKVMASVLFFEGVGGGGGSRGQELEFVKAARDLDTGR